MWWYFISFYFISPATEGKLFSALYMNPNQSWVFVFWLMGRRTILGYTWAPVIRSLLFFWAFSPLPSGTSLIPMKWSVLSWRWRHLADTQSSLSEQLSSQVLYSVNYITLSSLDYRLHILKIRETSGASLDLPSFGCGTCTFSSQEVLALVSFHV